MSETPFPNRCPCFVRAPIPPFDPREMSLRDFIEPAPLPSARWSWWAVEHLDGKDGPKTVICLHVMFGRDEFEARYDVPRAAYHDKVVWVIREPKTELDRWEKAVGIWDEIADRMETWPEVNRIIPEMIASVDDRHGPLNASEDRNND